MADRKVFAAATHFGNQPNEFVQSGMLGGVWWGEGKYFMHGFKKVGMFAARLQWTTGPGHQSEKIES